MKTAISIPDKLFRQADAAARKQKVSRSQLYATAVEAYLKQQDRDAIIRKVNEICALNGSALDPALERAQFEILEREDW